MFATGLLDVGGLSSSNATGNVGDLLQLIEQSEKSQAGETENDYFLDFINSDPKGPQATNQLFVT